MEKFRVFILDDDDAVRVGEEFKAIFAPDIECEIFFAINYAEAKKMVYKERFDIFILGDLPDADYYMNADKFVDMIFSLNQVKNIFFLFSDTNSFSKKFSQKKGIPYVYKGEVFGVPEKIFCLEEIRHLKRLMAVLGHFDFKVSYEELVKPISIYTDSKVFLKAYPLIINKLNSRGISYSVADSNGDTDIFVEEAEIEKVKEIALAEKADMEKSNSELILWSIWLESNL